MSERLALASPQEQPFRPPTSGNRMLLLLAFGIGALLCLAVLRDWLSFGGGALGQPGQPSEVRPSLPTTQTPEAGPVSAPSEPGAKLIIKCVAKSGAAAYVDGHCAAGTRTVVVAVQPDMNLADGLAHDERMASIRENSQAATAYERQVATMISATTPVGPAACAQLEALIKSVDEAARRPNIASELDRLASERRKLRDRQFALRCQ